MNLEEAYASWFKKEYETQDFTREIELDHDMLRAFARHCLGMGGQCVYSTLDSRGCMTYYKDGREFVEVLVPAVPAEHVIDTPGAGDSFAGGLGYGFLQDPRNYIQAARYGNALGSLRTQGKTLRYSNPWRRPTH